MVLDAPVYLEYIDEWEDILDYIPKSIPEDEAIAIAKQAFERAEAQKGETRSDYQSCHRSQSQ
jgi:hypothetical protein